jgi:hypothetical protein
MTFETVDRAVSGFASKPRLDACLAFIRRGAKPAVMIGWTAQKKSKFAAIDNLQRIYAKLICRG